MVAKATHLTGLITIALLLSVALNPAPLLAHVEAEMPDSVAEMEYRILLEFKPRDSSTRVKLAKVLLNQNKLAEAEQEFNRALTTSPNNLPALLGLSQLRLKQNRTTEALALTSKAVASAPDNASVLLAYGIVLAAANRPREALAIYRQGLDKLAARGKNPDTEHEQQQLENALQKLQDQHPDLNPDH